MNFIEFLKDNENTRKIFGQREIKIIEKQLNENNLRNKIDKIILFGSVAENKITIRSDIDIAVIFDELTKEEAFNFRKKILGQVPDNLDIQVFNFLPKKIQQEINKKGKILYIKKKNE